MHVKWQPGEGQSETHHHWDHWDCKLVKSDVKELRCTNMRLNTHTALSTNQRLSETPHPSTYRHHQQRWRRLWRHRAKVLHQFPSLSQIHDENRAVILCESLSVLTTGDFVVHFTYASSKKKFKKPHNLWCRKMKKWGFLSFTFLCFYQIHCMSRIPQHWSVSFIFLFWRAHRVKQVHLLPLSLVCVCPVNL